MRDDGHMQGGGCHDRRRRNHTGRRRDSTDGHRERPSSRAFAIRRENGGRDFRMLPAGSRRVDGLRRRLTNGGDG